MCGLVSSLHCVCILLQGSKRARIKKRTVCGTSESSKSGDRGRKVGKRLRLRVVKVPVVGLLLSKSNVLELTDAEKVNGTFG